jgi:hypothetical protein
MCLAPRSERDIPPSSLSFELERLRLQGVGDPAVGGWIGPPPPSTTEPPPPHHLPPAVEQLRSLEVGARSMILY